MSERRIVQCRSCGADMVWVVTRNKKRMPLDPKPNPEGRFLYDGEDDDGKPKVAFIHKDQVEFHKDEDRYTSHFSTCPNADEHRKGR